MINGGAKLYKGVQRFLAVLLSSLLVVFAQGDLYAQSSNYAPLDAPQLNQLVAPIALYPDALVAQILTASTYPDQVQQADGWVQQNGGMPPDQLGAAANGMPWDPSVKALTAFPTVLDYLTRNISWAGALGNAYYNQPGDVMNSVQAMRLQAQQAGAFRSIAHQRVYTNDGLIVIEPMEANTVYVPYYNPWTVYGAPLPVYAGFYVPPPPRGVILGGLAIGFGVGIGIGLFAHYGWGYHSWSPNWRGGVVVYNRTTYISRSTTVYNRGNFGGYNRGVYERSGPGVPRNFRPAVTARTAAFHPSPGGGARPDNRPGANRPGANPANRPAPAAVNRPGPRPDNRPAPGAANRPAARPENRPAAGAANRPAARPENRPAARPENRPAAGAANRPAPQARPQNAARPEQSRPGGGRPAEARPSGQAHGQAPKAQHGAERPHEKE
jgi:hypothetical protein